MSTEFMNSKRFEQEKEASREQMAALMSSQMASGLDGFAIAAGSLEAIRSFVIENSTDPVGDLRVLSGSFIRSLNT